MDAAGNLGNSTRRPRVSPGFLLAIEGIDGAGKRSVGSALASRLAHHREVRSFSFPDYASPSGTAIAAYLRNGTPALTAEAATMLFAADRLQHRDDIVALLDAGACVIVDRYVDSNAAYQSARVDLERRDEFVSWATSLEYGLMRMPRADFTVFLDVPATVSRTRTVTREVVSGRPADDHYEGDHNLQLTAMAQYRTFAERVDWLAIDAAANTLDEVVAAAWTAVAARMPM